MDASGLNGGAIKKEKHHSGGGGGGVVDETTPLQSGSTTPHHSRSGSRSGSRSASHASIRSQHNTDEHHHLQVSSKENNANSDKAKYDTEVTATEVRLKVPDDDTGAADVTESACTRYTLCVQEVVHGTIHSHGHLLKKLLLLLLLVGYGIYLGFAVYTSLSGAQVLLTLTGLALFYLVMKQLLTRFDPQLTVHVYKPVGSVVHLWWWKYCKWVLLGLVLLGVLVFVVVDIAGDTHRLTSLGGMLFFVFITFISSTNPARVNWRPVFWGLGLQVCLATMILRWPAGYTFFRFLGDQVKVFLDYADEGSKFVFGEEGYLMHRMAFKVFPIVIYFSAVISILYYWGFMQFIVCRIAWLMQFTMGTTAIESLNAACNIFIGMAESCVIMRPFIARLTKSELHAVMTGGFATVAGSYIALLVEVGASPEHLLSAAIMSAPAALAMAKLSYPETEVSCTRTPQDVYMEKTPARNLIEAACNGAIAAIKVVASVAANLIAILGLIAFLNSLLLYIGGRVGQPELSFQLVCSYIFWPVAAIMGVQLQDAGRVASLLGTKVFVDEFISFRDLGEMVKEGVINDRSTVIATYACCGFGSIAAVGVYIGALVSVCPARRGDISEVALRAMWNGNVAGFLTACIAGVLYTGERSLYTVESTTSPLSVLYNSSVVDTAHHNVTTIIMTALNGHGG